jgi:hypothetical protein
MDYPITPNSETDAIPRSAEELVRLSRWVEGLLDADRLLVEEGRELLDRMARPGHPGKQQKGDSGCSDGHRLPKPRRPQLPDGARRLRRARIRGRGVGSVSAHAGHGETQERPLEAGPNREATVCRGSHNGSQGAGENRCVR